MKFTYAELSTLENCARVAAEVFDADAVAANKAGQPRVAEQFLKQAREARALSARIEAEA